jgi:tetratricopeptide (TPR) repeat protein
VVVGQENPHHRAIDVLAQRTHDKRMAEFQPYPALSPWADPPPRELASDEQLALACEYFADAHYEEAETFASGAARSADTLEQHAEALRLRAVAVAEQGFLDRAIEYAEEALALDSDASGGLVAAGRLQTLLILWRYRESGGPLIRLSD